MPDIALEKIAAFLHRQVLFHYDSIGALVLAVENEIHQEVQHDFLF